MVTRPVDVEAVKKFYADWVAAGRPKVADFARAQGVDQTTARRWLNKYAAELGIAAEDQHAALHGMAPDADMVHPVPAPYVVKGVSTYYDKEGQRAGQWVKTQLDQQAAHAAMLAAIEALAVQLPRAKPAPKPKRTLGKLCTLYTLTDCHVGMRAWAPETGADWDLDIAEQTLTAAIDFLIAASRYSKVVAVATRILRRVIDAALKKHRRVVVVMAEGNHDMASSVWLRHRFGLLYENEPRVTVMDSELPYYVHVHGQTLLADRKS